ncbi:hypothetical protein SXIM_07350 [Streptomyces xiamenensis]|uniref:Uncharacterized protein n=1 Tax=Streptomyces xiamenensis TaxID=408015 RepID=A0A0F7FRJ6_9ACTN|nr:hypothetical protein SXIM_07350 [Streptomyces xiamenensis]
MARTRRQTLDGGYRLLAAQTWPTRPAMRHTPAPPPPEGRGHSVLTPTAARR